MKQKGLAPLVIIVLIALAVGGILLYQKQLKPAVAPQSFSQSSPSPIASDEIVSWKTYTNNNLKLSFRYPNSYTQETTDNNISLVRNSAYTSGGGQAGSDALKKGAIIAIELISAKSLAEKDLRSEYGSDIKVNQINVDQKQGIEIVLPNNQVDKYMYFQRDNGVVKISFSVGFENDSLENQQYIADFNQILSTFKFD